MVLFREMADPPKQFVYLLHQRADERTVIVREQGKQFLEGDAVRPAQGPGQLALMSFADAPGVLDGAALRFDLGNGEPLDPPAEEPLAVYPVVVEDGRILLEVPDGPLEVSE